MACGGGEVGIAVSTLANYLDSIDGPIAVSTATAAGSGAILAWFAVPILGGTGIVSLFRLGRRSN
jgi:hypothetical protein